MAERFTFTWKTSPEGLPEPEFDREEKWFRYVSIVNFPFWSGESMGKLPQSPSMISMDLFILIPGLILSTDAGIVRPNDARPRGVVPGAVCES